MVEPNYLAILVAGLVSMAIGFIWYAPPVFGTLWSTLTGVKMKKDKSMPLRSLGGLASMLLMAWVMAYFILGWHGSEVALHGANAMSGLAVGMQTGFWLWLGCIATILFGSVLWERRPFKLFVLNAAHWLVIALVMGAILGSWQ